MLTRIAGWKKLSNAFAVCIVGACLGSSATDSFLAPAATGRFVIDVSHGKELLKQCSRGTPAGVSEFWQPSPSEIDELEVSLRIYLDTRAKTDQAVPPGKQNYHRQYVGFVRKSEKFIYGNFYPAFAVAGHSNESKQPVGVCDGGPAFWGIVFRVSTKTFEEISFNGFG
jgi:hypothetical protein